MNIELWRQRKKELHLTLDDIAEQSGISRGTVARIFSKTNSYDNPERVTIEAIERVLGLSSKPDQEPTPPLTDAQRRLLSAFDELVPAMQDYVIEMVEKLVDSQPASASAKLQKKA
ncbi:MAG: helix-turn-helix transcriptional regulator [Clostridia bacterium]|nr:helix-turn-helix transcriptional regulator [Clostridia bacterium]